MSVWGEHKKQLCEEYGSVEFNVVVVGNGAFNIAQVQTNHSKVGSVVGLATTSSQPLPLPPSLCESH